MKKLMALLLVVVMAFSLVGVLALAEEAQPQIVVDGKKDDAYTDEKSFNSDYWYAYGEDNQTTVDPVDYERVKNTVWFNWDDEFVYIFFQAQSEDDLYVPQETPPQGYQLPSYYPSWDEEWQRVDNCEYVRLFLDTSPSLDYYSPCKWAGQGGNGDFCEHFACATGDNSPTNEYRLMARNYVAWDYWDDYSTPNEGVFMDYEGWRSRRLDPNSRHYRPQYGEGDEELAKKTYAENGGGNGEVASFIDYETNTYGIEVKFRRAPGEECFQFNICNKVMEKVWEEEGPELPYHLSFCNAWWLNSQEMIAVYYADYDNDLPTPPEVITFLRKLENLPDLEELTVEYIKAVDDVKAAYDALADEYKDVLVEQRLLVEQYVEKMEKLSYVAALGDVNQDGEVNANDALVALRAAVGKATLDEGDALRADVNGDQKADAKDALEMLQFSVQKRTEFSVVKTLGL